MYHQLPNGLPGEWGDHLFDWVVVKIRKDGQGVHKPVPIFHIQKTIAKKALKDQREHD